MIYQATYSNVGVYEYICRNIPVMRRKRDGYLNATQLLKVADFDKPHRTRILEREVQIGIHEKVQGGYGKYQGTWVPFERGLALAKQYHIYDMLKPLLEYVPDLNNSPPLAPKHTQSSLTSSTNHSAQYQHSVSHHSHPNSRHSISSSTPATVKPARSRKLTTNRRSRASTSSFTRNQVYHSPVLKSESSSQHEPSEVELLSEEESDDNSSQGSISHISWTDGILPSATSPEEYKKILLNTFVNEPPSYIPHLLRNPPTNLDVNILIDDEGHAAIHWSAALARMKILKLLLGLNANSCALNHQGQTALIRAVLFTNNFDNKTFPSLLQLLSKSIAIRDSKGKTILHYICTTASHKGKVQASRYYMEAVLEWIQINKNQKVSLSSIGVADTIPITSLINIQDEDGNTPLLIISKIGNKSIVKQLSLAGADWTISNLDGNTPGDFMSMEEKENAHLASTPLMASRGHKRKMFDIKENGKHLSPLRRKSKRAEEPTIGIQPNMKKDIYSERAHSVGVPISFLPQKPFDGITFGDTPVLSTSSPNIHTPQSALLSSLNIPLNDHSANPCSTSNHPKSTQMMSDISTLLRELEASSKLEIDETDQELELLTNQLNHVIEVSHNAELEFMELKNNFKELCSRLIKEHQFELPSTEIKQEEVSLRKAHDITPELSLALTIAQRLNEKSISQKEKLKKFYLQKVEVHNIPSFSKEIKAATSSKEKMQAEINELEKKLLMFRDNYPKLVDDFVNLREKVLGPPLQKDLINYASSLAANETAGQHNEMDTKSDIATCTPSSEVDTRKEAKWLKLLAICSGCSVDEILNLLPDIVEMVRDMES